MKKKNGEEYLLTHQKLFWIDDDETEEEVLEQIKEWINKKVELENTERLAFVSKNTFNRFYDYIQKLKEGK